MIFVILKLGVCWGRESEVGKGFELELGVNIWK
jgi:hypothetical protein